MRFKLNITICNNFILGKHPVSLLGEYCSKKKLGAPVYELCFECGPDHRKNFLFKVSNVITSFYSCFTRIYFNLLIY